MRWYDCEVEIVMALAINTVPTHASVTFSQNYQIYLWNSRNIPIKPVFVKRIKPTTMIIHHQGNCIVCVEKLSRIVVGDCEWSYSCVDIFTLGADKTSDCLWQYLYYGITLNTLNSNDMAAVWLGWPRVPQLFVSSICWLWPFTLEARWTLKAHSFDFMRDMSFQFWCAWQ